ncbi:hypothetical protein HK099_003374 [Clydaea vesicula]|uniref:Uncharacterized protein n=1 Tax=Clydaea vesicula TaxID=447962 RepID=A0AAD5XWB2_9FUNG|nr:hypothetical protein HK099_003374 [Clydaea vesicula]
MDVNFEKNRIKPDDVNFIYDVQKTFDAPVEKTDWDSSSSSSSASNNAIRLSVSSKDLVLKSSSAKKLESSAKDLEEIDEDVLSAFSNDSNDSNESIDFTANGKLVKNKLSKSSANSSLNEIKKIDSNEETMRKKSLNENIEDESGKESVLKSNVIELPFAPTFTNPDTNDSKPELSEVSNAVATNSKKNSIFLSEIPEKNPTSLLNLEPLGNLKKNNLTELKPLEKISFPTPVVNVDNFTGNSTVESQIQSENYFFDSLTITNNEGMSAVSKSPNLRVENEAKQPAEQNKLTQENPVSDFNKPSMIPIPTSLKHVSEVINTPAFFEKKSLMSLLPKLGGLQQKVIEEKLDANDKISTLSDEIEDDMEEEFDEDLDAVLEMLDEDDIEPFREKYVKSGVKPAEDTTLQKDLKIVESIYLKSPVTPIVLPENVTLVKSRSNSTEKKEVKPEANNNVKLSDPVKNFTFLQDPLESLDNKTNIIPTFHTAESKVNTDKVIISTLANTSKEDDSGEQNSFIEEDLESFELSEISDDDKEDKKNEVQKKNESDIEKIEVKDSRISPLTESAEPATTISNDVGVVLKEKNNMEENVREKNNVEENVIEKNNVEENSKEKKDDIYEEDFSDFGAGETNSNFSVESLKIKNPAVNNLGSLNNKTELSNRIKLDFDNDDDDFEFDDDLSFDKGSSEGSF